MPDFSFKMHQIQFQLGFCRRPRCSLAAFGERKGKGRRRRKGREREGRIGGKGKRKGRERGGGGRRKEGEEGRGRMIAGTNGRLCLDLLFIGHLFIAVIV